MCRVRIVLTTAALIGAVIGCNKSDKPDATSASYSKPTNSATAGDTSSAGAAPAQMPTKPSKSVPDPLRGKVMETINSGGYTYLLLATDSGDHWAAGRTFAVAEGDEVEVGGLMAMENFSSPTLKRSFPVIQFASRAGTVGAGAQGGANAQIDEAAQAALPQGHPPLSPDAQAAAPSAHGATPSEKAGATPSAMSPFDATGITVPEGGVTVADLFARKAEFGDKVVKFRGRVVKLNKGIMGRNWLHIQDGTGGPGTNDITVTSKTGSAPKGSIVTVEGTLGLDRDFGAGYAYGVIVENATIMTP